MRRNAGAESEVKAAWQALQPKLGQLADKISTARDSWSEDYGDVASVGSEVKDLANRLSEALSDWLPELPTHDKLDAFLYELAERHKGEAFGGAAEATGRMLEFLRQISYGTLPSVDDAPDAEDLSIALEDMLDALRSAT
ncbi:MAG: hypothetical protein AAGF11_40475 [Myxococcota bacterium]